MKKYYDKVLFLLGLVVLAIGAGIFVFKGGTPKGNTLPPMKLTGTAFEAIPPPKIEEANADWESPADQGEDRNESGWTYYVFTPPKIWWQTGEGWTAQPPSGINAPRPFGVRLVAAKKDLYRVQLEGTAGNGDAKDVIDFSDEETGFDFHLRVGEENPRVQVKVLDMTVDRVEKEHGIIEKVAKVSLLDERTNQTVSLTQGEPFSPTNNQYYILQIGPPYPQAEWKVAKIGDSHPLPNKASFVVTALDFEKPSVTVEKHSFNKKGLEVKPTPKVLTLVDDSAPAVSPTQSTQSMRTSKPMSKPSPPPLPKPTATPAPKPYSSAK